VQNANDETENGLRARHQDVRCVRGHPIAVTLKNDAAIMQNDKTVCGGYVQVLLQIQRRAILDTQFKSVEGYKVD
jgi:hypothetical protein